MADQRNILPPLEWVRAFEAAARLSSFTGAARELGLTQAAVSQRIRNLELRLGAQLFDRQARGVTLSLEGETWLPQVQAALNQLEHSTANLFASPRRKITIVATGSVIELWIVPRLSKIVRGFPDLQVSFETIQKLPDHPRTDADFEIIFGDGVWPGHEARRVFFEDLSPVAAPALLRYASGDWERLPRIATYRPRFGWRDWSTAMGESPAPPARLRFDTFAQALRAAEFGQGVLLGSLALCRMSLDAGRLVRLTGKAIRMTGCYWITWSRSQPGFRERRALLDCLTKEMNPELEWFNEPTPARPL
jgi:LysR family glycine cleavage system transcriptional activator